MDLQLICCFSFDWNFNLTLQELYQYVNNDNLIDPSINNIYLQISVFLQQRFFSNMSRHSTKSKYQWLWISSQKWSFVIISTNNNNIYKKNTVLGVCFLISLWLLSSDSCSNLDHSFASTVKSALLLQSCKWKLVIIIIIIVSFESLRFAVSDGKFIYHDFTQGGFHGTKADPVSSAPVSSAVASVPALSVALPLFKRIHK